MILRTIACALLLFVSWGSVCRAAGDPVAGRLASEARKAQDHGQIVRAYLLYAEAAARDPHNPSYRLNRDSLASAAKLLTKAQIEDNEDIWAEIKEAEEQSTSPEPPIELASAAELRSKDTLAPIPHIQASSTPATFNLRGDARTLFTRVTQTYGVQVTFDRDLPQGGTPIHFELDKADFQTALEGLTAVTNTFVFPVSTHELFVAQDTQPKRAELEPLVLLDFTLPNALEEKDLVEAANAVRTTLGMTFIAWDGETHTVLVRDRATRVRAVRALLESLLLPRGQVSIEVQFITVDKDKTYHWGSSLQTSYPIVDFGHFNNFQSVISTASGFANYATFGAGSTLFGLGLANSTIFGTYTNSVANTVYDATVVVGDRQTANLHVGEKYPIAQALYTGFSQTQGSSLYNPIGQVTMEDLGIILKMTPHINGEGDINLDLEASVRALGTQTYNTVPAISERSFKGSVSMREGQWAILAGLDQNTLTRSRNGWLGLSQIPGLNQILSENQYERQISDTLVVLKPTITRLPMSSEISTEYLLGSAHGPRVLF